MSRQAMMVGAVLLAILIVVVVIVAVGNSSGSSSGPVVAPVKTEEQGEGQNVKPHAAQVPHASQAPTPHTPPARPTRPARRPPRAPAAPAPASAPKAPEAPAPPARTQARKAIVVVGHNTAAYVAARVLRSEFENGSFMHVPRAQWGAQPPKWSSDVNTSAAKAGFRFRAAAAEPVSAQSAGDYARLLQGDLTEEDVKAAMQKDMEPAFLMEDATTTKVDKERQMVIMHRDVAEGAQPQNPDSLVSVVPFDACVCTLSLADTCRLAHVPAPPAVVMASTQPPRVRYAISLAFRGGAPRAPSVFEGLAIEGMDLVSVRALSSEEMPPAGGQAEAQSVVRANGVRAARGAERRAAPGPFWGLSLQLEGEEVGRSSLVTLVVRGLVKAKRVAPRTHVCAVSVSRRAAPRTLPPRAGDEVVAALARAGIIWVGDAADGAGADAAVRGGMEAARRAMRHVARA